MADRSEILRQRLQATFRIEAEEHLQAISEILDPLARDPAGPETMARMDTLFRVMHTLKGAARSVGMAEVERVSHSSETLLSDIVHQRVKFAASMVGLLQEATDVIAAVIAGSAAPDRVARVLARLSGKPGDAAPVKKAEPARPRVSIPDPQPAPPPPAMMAPASAELPPAPPARTESPRLTEPPRPPPAPPAASPPRWDRDPAPARSPAPAAVAGGERIRVEVEQLDRAMVLAEDLLGPKLALAERLRGLRAVLSEVQALRHEAGSVKKGGSAPVAESQANGIGEGLRAIERQLRRQIVMLSADHKSLSATVTDLGEELRKVRMMPAGAILESFPRMVRDLCAETGKEVAWSVQGGEFSVDRRVLDQIKDPLIHMVRNAIDHGIEAPADREAKGKPRQGSVTLRITPTEGGKIEFVLADDGRGFALDPIKEAIVRARVMSAEQVEALSEERIRALAFHSGVSTSSVITNISGRGLGLAIVQDRVERIDGRLITESVPGRGATIRIEVPASIATHRGLLVRAGGTPFLWALETVERVIRVPRAKALGGLAQGLLALGGETLAFRRLSAILGLGGAPRDEEQKAHLTCVIGRTAERRAAFLVDEVVGAHEVLVKEFRPPLLRVRNIGAAGLLGTGELVLVLRPSDVLSLGAADAEAAMAEAAPQDRVRRILVVDDSITTRTMERNLFEAAGYQVRIAADGVEAWGILQIEEIDLVVSDVDMPKMDGFQLTARIRGDHRTAELPVVLVTALEAREDKDRGIQVGANAYVLKSAFDQTNLLEIVNRLV